MGIRNINRQSVRIARSVTKQSDAELDVYRTIHEDFPRIKIELRPSFSSTITQASWTFAKYGRMRRSPNLLAGKILPIPESGEREIELKVKGAEFMGTHMGYRALVLLLDDPEQILISEQAEYMRRAGRSYTRPYSPHISLMNVDSFFSTSDLQAWAEERMPPTIGLQPIHSIPETALENERLKLKKILVKPASRPHSEIRITETVRTLHPNPIPEALIKSMRVHQQ